MRVLRYRADLRSVTLVVLTLVMMSVQWLGVVRHPALVAATALLAFVSCIVNHNHQHSATFASRSLNRVFGCLLSLAIGQPAVAIVPMHNLNHHPHNNSSKDFVRASQVRLRWRLLDLFAFAIVAVAGYARAKRDVMRSWRRKSPRLYDQLVVERWGLYPALLLLLCLRPLETLLYLGLPYAVGQWAIISVNLVQHDGCDADSTYNHSRNFTGRLLNWIFLNNGFHTAHHIRPALHWSELPSYHSRIRHRIDRRLECRSLTWTVFRLYVWPARATAERRQRAQGGSQ